MGGVYVDKELYGKSVDDSMVIQIADRWSGCGGRRIERERILWHEISLSNTDGCPQFRRTMDSSPQLINVAIVIP